MNNKTIIIVKKITPTSPKITSDENFSYKLFYLVEYSCMKTITCFFSSFNRKFVVVKFKKIIQIKSIEEYFKFKKAKLVLKANTRNLKVFF